MRVTALEISAALENVTSLTIGDDFQFFMKFKCTNCNAETPKEIAFELEPKLDPGSKSTRVNVCYKCKDCKRQCTVTVVPESLRAYTEEDNCAFAPLVEMDCRGCVPSTFHPLSNFSAVCAQSGHKFANEVDLSQDDSEWADYDEKSGLAVGVYEFKYKFSTYAKK